MSQERTDVELDKEWKPSGRRPQSTMARSLAAALDNAFMLDSEVDNLTNSIHYKQTLVSMQSRELEALEARLRATENRLRMQKGEAPLEPVKANDGANNDNSTSQNGSHKGRTPLEVSTTDKERGLPPLSTPNQSDDGFTTNASTSPATTDQDDEAADHAGVHGRGDAQGHSEGKQGWS
ncbi:Ca2+dependent lipid-binding protein, contains C2 domain protein [Trichophyton interdigitale]|uniref:Ca2+-dependent lipid-binding protein, contains C2 domain protein n=2 Tax=Trichophyton interdigitale TaxID=101480 RepID=A0A9P4YLD1_9EURO|nr:hypothetical protein H101_07984 [Trichophyton interdigitale H6]KAF3895250.1 Ca2+-dependent lipid-binding protein, contains C2 domain protein [Trichophyton interdigitale]KAF3901215.1 Ca2+-dependent lipid-binding protein, contains C2 domain protein [Trichophyton interdigitale]KAG8212091.1 Ca2+dependent lipid-binding protein, contains C2 domain protein [Trichophyton interdigitale]KDB23913.1 hypothetical protein H109_04155 [Trichophyton interdigitale MR816]